MRCRFAALSKDACKLQQGQLAALTPERRGRKPPDPTEEELARLRQENERLRARLEQTELIMDVPKNSLDCLG